MSTFGGSNRIDNGGRHILGVVSVRGFACGESFHDPRREAVMVFDA
jgi:hypothetical protein